MKKFENEYEKLQKKSNKEYSKNIRTIIGFWGLFIMITCLLTLLLVHVCSLILIILFAFSIVALTFFTTILLMLLQ